MWQGTLILLYLRLKKRNPTRNFLIALKWMVWDLFLSTVENFSISREETNSKWYGFQHKKCGQESIMEICNLMMEKLVKWRKSRSERCDFTRKLVKWKKSRSEHCYLTEKKCGQEMEICNLLGCGLPQVIIQWWKANGPHIIKRCLKTK